MKALTATFSPPPNSIDLIDWNSQIEPEKHQISDLPSPSHTFRDASKGNQIEDINDFHLGVSIQLASSPDPKENKLYSEIHIKNDLDDDEIITAFSCSLGMSKWIFCIEPGLAAAIPLAVTEADDFTNTDYLSWGMSGDYFDPTMPTTTEEAFTIQGTVPFVADGGKPEENPGANKEENPSNPADEETQGSVLASNVDSLTTAPNQVEVTPLGEEMEAATKVQVNEKEGLAKGNSSDTSSEKGTIQTTPAASEEAAASPVLGSEEVPSTISNEQPEAGVTDSSLAPASATREKTDDIDLNGVPSSGQEKILDSVTGETNTGSEPKPTLALWEDATDGVAEPEDATPQTFPDASSETGSPLSIPGAPSSNMENLPVAEPSVTPANDGHSVPPTSGDAIEGEKLTPVSGLSLPDLLPPSNTPSESSEMSEPATVSIQPSPSGKDNLGGEPAITEGRGDSDSSVSVTVPDRDAETTLMPSLEDPELGPESSADVTPAESEDFVGAEASNSPPADGTTNFLPGIASPSWAPSSPSDLDSDATVASPLGLSMAPGHSSLLPEDDEIQTVSVTKEEEEEGSGTASSNETPFMDMESGTASPLKPGEKLANSELAENGQPGSAIQSEMIPSSSERTPLNSAGVTGEESEGLFDMDVTSSAALEDETAAKDQVIAGETAFPPSQGGTSSERLGEGDSLGSAPGNSGSMMVTESNVASGSVTNEEGEGRTDFPPSVTELAPADGTQLPISGSELLEDGESSSPSPLQNTVVPESDTAEAPSNGSPGSPGSSQPDGNMQADSEATEGSEEPQDTNADAVNGEEASSAVSTTDTGSANEGVKFPALPSGDEMAGAASESEVSKGTISESNNNLDEINTLPSESGTDAEEGTMTNTGGFAEITDDGSGNFSPFLADSGTSTKTGGLAGETSSTLFNAPSSFTSEAEEGKDSPSPPFGSSLSGNEAPGGTKGGEGNTGLLANEGSVTISGENQTGTDISDAEPGSPEGAELPVGQSGTLTGGEISGQPLLEEGETSVTATSSGEEFPSTSASSGTDGETSAISVSAGEDSPSGSGKNSSPFLISKSSGVQPSGSPETPDSYQSSSDDALKSESALESSAGSEIENQELEDTSSVAEKEASLGPSATESQTVSPSAESLGSAGSSLEDGEEPQLSPDDTASEGAEQSEGEGEMSMAPSATMSQSASDGVETNGLLVAGNDGSQLSPDSTQKMGSESASGAEKEPEDISFVSGMKSSSAEGVETSFSGAAMGSQPFTDGSTKGGTAADLGALDEVEQWEGSSPVNEEETLPGSSSTESPGDEDVSGELGKERPFLSAEGMEAATSESEASKGSQPSLSDATAGTGDSDGINIQEGSSSMSEKEASLAPLAAESHSVSPSAEGVETASAGSANDGGSQPSLNSAEADQPGISSSVSEKGASSAPSATEAQPGFSFPGGFNNDGLSTSGSPTSSGEGSQLPPDYASGAGSKTGEESGDVSDTSGKKSSLVILPTRSPLSSLSNEGEEMSVSGLGSNVGSQPSPNDAETETAGPGVSEEAKQGGSSSAVGEEEAPSGASVIGSKSPGASPGEETANNEDSQAYGGASAGAIASGMEEESEELTNGKKLPLSPSDTESQSPGASAGEEVSGGLSAEESSLPTAGLGSTGTKSTSSSETGLSPKNIAEQPGDKSGPMNAGEPSSQSSLADDGSVVAVINKASGETVLSGSLSPDGTVALQGTSAQAPGITDSFLPRSETGGVGGNIASPGSAEKSVLTMSGQPALSYSNTLGGTGSTSPMAKGDAEGLAGGLGSGTVTSSSIGTSLQSSGSGGTKVATDQQSEMPLSPSTSSSSSETQPFGSYNSGIESPGNVAGEASSQSQAVEAKEIGKMDSFPNGLASSSNEVSVGDAEGLSPSASEGRGDTDSSSLTADKGTATISGEAHPSLSSTPLCPATPPQLPVMESVSEVNAVVSPQSSTAEITKDSGHILSGNPSASVLASSSITSLGSEATKSGSMTSTSVSSLPDSSVQSEAAAAVSKDTSGDAKASATSGKPDASLAVSGVGLEAVKSSQSASETLDEEEDVKMSDKKVDSKKADKKEESKKSDKKDSKKLEKEKDSDEEDNKKSDKKDSKKLEKEKGSDKDNMKSDKKEDSKKSDKKEDSDKDDNKKEDSKKSDNKEDIKKSDNKPNSASQNSKKTATADENSATLDTPPIVPVTGYLFPYGPKANDKEYVERRVGFSSPLFEPEIGVPLGNVLRDSLYFTSNGQIIFPVSGKDVSSNPNPPLGGFNGRENVPMVAAFWDNADFSRGSGTIFYQDYFSPSLSSSGDGFFRNDDLMSEAPAVKYRPDGFPGYNTGVHGLWIYKLYSRVRLNYRQRCLDWLSNERQPAFWNKDLPPCPCSLRQGVLDNRFIRSKKGLLDSSFTMLYSSLPNKYGAGVRCLYKNANGQLVDGHQERIWKGSRRNFPYNVRTQEISGQRQ
ncbi:hypothetical protein JD844_007870 [Phrynosoma platyrhinos]|uniref:AMOP domain-containing protein n=1 Tax=Phrynosoma platyrhinos TaxID=52577 RepID=A0ABQ7T432_PHRPL|nr:hypothetical protein JD844_007870 [Phrynosoma platyrhinos]